MASETSPATAEVRRAVDLVVPSFVVQRDAIDAVKRAEHQQGAAPRKPIFSSHRPSLRPKALVAKLNEPVKVKRASIVVAEKTEIVVRPMRSLSAYGYFVERVQPVYERRKRAVSWDSKLFSRHSSFVLTSNQRVTLKDFDPGTKKKTSDKNEVVEQKEEEAAPVQPKKKSVQFQRRRPMISSPFHRRALLTLNTRPFKRPVFGKYNPRELSNCMEDVYSPVDEVLRSLPIKYSRRDVIVCSPLRSGQTPVVQAVAALLLASSDPDAENMANKIFEREDVLMRSVGNPGSRLPHLPRVPFDSANGPVRLFRTHMSLRCFIRPRIEHSLQYLREDAPRIIVPLRDPCRVAESWFRHVSQVFESVEGKSFPFGHSDFKAFCPGSTNAIPFEKGEEYERFVAKAIECASLPNVLIIFHEDMVTRPDLVVRSIESFLELKLPEDILDRAAYELRKAYKKEGLRLEPIFSEEYLAFVRQRWADEVTYRGDTTTTPIISYYDFYERTTGRPYPVAKFGEPVIETDSDAPKKPVSVARRLSKRLLGKLIE